MNYKKSLYAASIFVLAVFICEAQEKKFEKEFTEVLAEAQSKASSVNFDMNEKRESVKQLVQEASDFLQNNRLIDACKVFSHTKEWMRGELYVFILDIEGTFLAHLQDELIWKNYLHIKDSFGVLYVKNMIEKAKSGGGWVTYEWRDATKNSYVQAVKKDGKEYIVGAGYYPHSKKDKVVTLVKGAVAVIERDIQEERPIEQAFSTISYPLGQFVYADLYLYAMRFDGMLLAHGSNPMLVGVKTVDYQDKAGKFVNKEIIEELRTKKNGEGVWVDYESRHTNKKAYAEKVVDGQGNEYFIACGYYPNANREEAVDLVRRSYQYMKSHGLTQAVKEFSESRGDYVFGDLELTVYDLKGIVISDTNKAMIGQNHYDEQDEDGRYYVQEIIEKAKEDNGWIDFQINKSFKSVYVEQVDIGINTYVISCGLYPVSKRETTQLLAKSGASYMRTHTNEEAFGEFVDKKSNFIRGDLFVFVFDMVGNCYVHGDDHDLIWKNLLDTKDDNGKPYVKLLVNAARGGPAQVTYHLNGVPVVAYIETVEKDDMVYVVGSNFYK